jgi:hypothetical protein
MILISMCEKQWALKSEMYSDIISLLMQESKFENDELTLNKNIEILTFNYDVSLDIYCKQYLEKALYDDKKTLTPNQTKALRNKIKHIYGSLWQDGEEYGYGCQLNEFFLNQKTNNQTMSNNNDYFTFIYPFRNSQTQFVENFKNRDFSTTKDIFLCQVLSTGIKSIYENYTQSLIRTINHERKAEQFSEYSKKVQEADIIYIMGFGFDKINCETVLGFDKIRKQRDEKERLKNELNKYGQNTEEYKKILDEIKQTKEKKIFYTNYGDVPIINDNVKRYFGDGENVVKSKLGCSETMSQEFNFDS